MELTQFQQGVLTMFCAGAGLVVLLVLAGMILTRASAPRTRTGNIPVTGGHVNSPDGYTGGQQFVIEVKNWPRR